jgi:ubiquinone/menaquinone biosynthesis C-methylase UbiE
MPTAHSRFESWAPAYELSALQSLLFEPVHRTVLQQLHQHAPRAARALDVGCGTGRLLAAARGSYPLAVGVDASPRMLAEAQRLRAGSLLVCAVAEQLPFAAGTFDVVTATLSLRHWQEADRAVRELARVLSPAGVLVVADADTEEEAMRLRRRWHLHDPCGCQLRVLLGRCGLEVVDYRLAPVRGPAPRIHVLTARRAALTRNSE